ncbi:MAG: hypothetical protein AAB914_04340 [Patescibacteria group bacterium]
MNKSKNNILEKTTLFALTLAMLTSIVAFPASVSAATKKTTIPKSFANKESCLAKLKTYKLASLKTYGDKRIDTRLKSVDKYPGDINKAYAPYERAEGGAKKSVDDANKFKARFAKNKKAVQKANPKVLQNPQIKGNKDSLAKEVRDTKLSLESKKTDLKKANTSVVAADTICYVMFDLRVYSYLGAKIKAQKKVDSVRLQNNRNQSRYNAIVATYEANKTNKKYAKKASKLEPRIKNLKSPISESEKLQSLQNRINAVTVDSLNSSPQAATAGKADLAAVAKEAASIGKTAKLQAKPIDSLYKTIKKVFKNSKSKLSNATAPTEEEVIAEPEDDILEPETEEEDLADDPECTPPYCYE